MGTIGPLDGWVGSSAVVLAKQTAIAKIIKKWPIITLQTVTLGAALGDSGLFGQYYSTRAYPPVEWTHGAHSKSRN